MERINKLSQQLSPQPAAEAVPPATAIDLFSVKGKVSSILTPTPAGGGGGGGHTPPSQAHTRNAG